MTDVNPALALAAGIGIILLAALVLWPGTGMLARRRRSRRNTRRVLIEDALKHLYDCEYKRIPCTTQSLAGTLSLSSDESSKLLARLGTMGLIRTAGEASELTGEGRAYALRIIRVHRLWERFLADETGLGETEWHPEAERAEHIITSEEADALEAQMGHPRYDPHGDPIPTASGDIPRRQGTPLTELGDGEFAEIVHVEDEPAVVYSQLVAQGLRPGVRIRIIETTKDRIRFEADGIENILAPLVAANVTIVRLAREPEPAGPYDSLASLQPGERARVVGLSRACRGQQRRRLMDLGILPGATIAAEFRSASGDPTAYIIRGATIALRRKQASMIHIDQREGT
jgi:DtxR family Mn-dependent transcriptional regulator